MNLAPILDAPLAVQLHVLTVVPAAIIGLFILILPKGTLIHKLAGRIWVALMVSTSVFSLFIHEIDLFYGFSPIHIFSFVIPLSCYWAIRAVRKGQVRQHQVALVSAYIGGIGIAGGFAFAPGRIMNRVFTDIQNSTWTTIMDAVFSWQLSVVVGLSICAFALYWSNQSTERTDR